MNLYKTQFLHDENNRDYYNACNLYFILNISVVLHINVSVTLLHVESTVDRLHAEPLQMLVERTQFTSFVWLRVHVLTETMFAVPHR